MYPKRRFRLVKQDADHRGSPGGQLQGVAPTHAPYPKVPMAYGFDLDKHLRVRKESQAR
jgi:hypothetical protein